MPSLILACIHYTERPVVISEMVNSSGTYLMCSTPYLWLPSRLNWQRVNDSAVIINTETIVIRNITRGIKVLQFQRIEPQLLGIYKCEVILDNFTAVYEAYNNVTIKCK